MSTLPSFPGVNPYLENPYRWPEIHTSLIVEMAATLNSQLQPKYRAAIDTRVNIDTTPTPCEVAERYLEVREVSTKRVLTAIELLSPVNKRNGEGRKKYLKKRESVLGSSTHLIEIDLLRKGKPMPAIGGERTDYQILVSWANKHPSAERYAFNLKEPIPDIPVPLQTGDVEPVLRLKQLLESVCQRTMIEADIDYNIQPQPPLAEDDFEWVRSL